MAGELLEYAVKAVCVATCNTRSGLTNTGASSWCGPALAHNQTVAGNLVDETCSLGCHLPDWPSYNSIRNNDLNNYQGQKTHCSPRAYHCDPVPWHVPYMKPPEAATSEQLHHFYVIVNCSPFILDDKEGDTKLMQGIMATSGKVQS